MRRRLFNLAILAFATLAAVILLLHLRSLLRLDRLFIRTSNAQWIAQSTAGRWELIRYSPWPNAPAWDFQTMPADFRQWPSPLISYNSIPVREHFPFFQHTGKARLSLTPTGTVDWNTPNTIAAYHAGPPPVAWVTFSSISIVLWPLAAIFTLPPVIKYLPATLTLLRHRHRRARHHCPHCNYDLRATPTRCPECGAPGPITPPPAPNAHMA